MTSTSPTDPPSPPLRLEVGRITRAHGLRGEVAVQLATNRLERLSPGAVMFSGERELHVVAARPHGQRYLVRFEDVDDRDAAEELVGATLTAAPLDDPDELWVHELVGATVVDAAGREHGRVVAVEANPASDLLVLSGGELVPLTFVLAPPEGGRVRVDVPPGLLSDGESERDADASTEPEPGRRGLHGPERSDELEGG